MRWNRLFDDLEVQLDHELHLEEQSLRHEEERLRLGRLSLRERIAALAAPGTGRTVRLEIGTDDVCEVRPSALGRDWLGGDLVGDGPRVLSCIIPFAAIGAVVVDSDTRIAESLESERESTARLMERIGLVFALRDLCRRRSGVTVVTENARSHGTLDRIARDHVDLAVHEKGQPRRTRAIVQTRIIPIDRIRYVMID